KSTNTHLDHRAEPPFGAVSCTGVPFVLNICRANVQRGIRGADRKLRRRDGPGMRRAWPRDWMLGYGKLPASQAKRFCGRLQMDLGCCKCITVCIPLLTR